MYHIKNDKRMHTSARMISEALDECLKTKDLKDITISEILKESTVSRATFYRLFDNISDVLVYQCDKVYEELLEQIKADEPANRSLDYVVIRFTEFWNRHYALAEKIIFSNQFHILFESNQKYIRDILQSLYKETVFSNTQCDYIASALSATLITWVKKNNSEKPEDYIRDLTQVVIDMASLIGHK